MSRRSAPLQRAPGGAHDLVVPARAPQPAAGRAAASTAVRSNQALQRLAAPAVQARLEVGAPGDAFEREAEATADRILRAPQPQERRKEPERRGAGAPVRRKGDSERKRKPDEARPAPAAGALQRADAPPQRKEPLEKQRVRRSAASRLEDESFTETLRAQHDGEAVPAVSAGLEQTLRARRGGGRALSADERGFFEPRFGHDLGAVRLHTDDGAAQAAAAMNARAFTYGNDIYFAAGRYRPDSDAGRHLMAHELTHTLQQGGADGRVQRQNDPPPAGAAAPAATTALDPATMPLAHGRPDPAANTLTFDRIEIPDFKTEAHRGALYTAHKPLKQRRAYERGVPAQRDVWRDRLATTTETARQRIDAKITQAHGGSSAAAGATHVLSAPSRFGRTPPRYFIGTAESIAQEMVLPSWDSQSQPHAFDVDHIVELQLANWSTETWANDVANMELLDSRVNQESGGVIMRTIAARVTDFIAHSQGQFGTTVEEVKDRFTLVFNDFGRGEGGASTVNERQFWTKQQIDDGQHVNDAVRVESPAALGGEGCVLVFPGHTGGVPKSFVWPGATLPAVERDWLQPYVITAKQFDTTEAATSGESLGTLSFNIAASNPDWLPFEGGDETVPVRRVPGARFAGTIDKTRVRDALRRVRAKRFSPIEIDTFDVLPGRGLVVEGRILPELPLLRDTSLNFELDGGDLRLFKQFRIGDFSLPPPFTVNDSSLTLSLGTRSGLSIEGALDFGIERVGQGQIVGRIGTTGDFEVEGRFNFDTRLFDPAEIRLAYREGQLSGEGTLGIPEGRVRGIRSATINIGYANETLTATGTASLSIPGVQQAGINVEYSEADGLTIGGTLQLANDIPGIRSGSIEAQVRKPADSDEYLVSARGTAVPAIPGVDATLTVEYDNGALTIEGEAAYARGMLSGSVRVGATNRPLDAQGNPLPDAPPADALRAYGGGEVTIRIAPWLQGTAGLRLLPNGEIEVSGSIGLPSALDVFPEKRLDRNVFDIGLDIPIVGVAVAGQRIGIFATIRGGLDVSAGIGPGQLRELALGITYNPAHEDQTRVTGDARLVVPAQAGLRLFVRGGLGAGIPIVSATAALEIGGSLGLEGAVEAGVHVDWSPASGLAIDAEGEIYVQPKFKFDVTGMVLVEADLLVTTVELYSQRWNLAQFEYGSDLRFGVRFPIRYREGQPFDIALSDVQFDVPEVDPQSLLGDLIDRIA
ncbi:MAG: DUF4157 domain-containing protein [Betaproteobacteria bacterium]